MGKKLNVLLRFVVVLASVLILSSCAGVGDGFGVGGKPKLSNPEYERQFEPVKDSGYSGQTVETKEKDDASAVIDLSSLSQGYVVASVTAGTEVRFGIDYNGNRLCIPYELANDGSYGVFPLSGGSGHYTFTVYLHTEGENYIVFMSAEADATLVDERAPFIVPNQEVNYTPQSNLVAFSRQLIEHCSSDLEAVQEIYYWIAHNVVYDTGKAEQVVSKQLKGYHPNPDEILASKTGICYDYAALAAAMLRANDIPCQLAKGDVMVDGKEAAHAWNYIWIEEQGWIAVKLAAHPNAWNQVDITFAASGDEASVAKYIGSGDHYILSSVH